MEKEVEVGNPNINVFPKNDQLYMTYEALKCYGTPYFMQRKELKNGLGPSIFEYNQCYRKNHKG